MCSCLNIWMTAAVIGEKRDHSILRQSVKDRPGRPIDFIVLCVHQYKLLDARQQPKSLLLLCQHINDMIILSFGLDFARALTLVPFTINEASVYSVAVDHLGLRHRKVRAKVDSAIV